MKDKARAIKLLVQLRKSAGFESLRSVIRAIKADGGELSIATLSGLEAGGSRIPTRQTITTLCVIYGAPMTAQTIHDLYTGAPQDTTGRMFVCPICGGHAEDRRGRTEDRRVVPISIKTPRF